MKKQRKKSKKYYITIIVRTEEYSSIETRMKRMTADEIDQLNDFIYKLCKFSKNDNP